MRIIVKAVKKHNYPITTRCTCCGSIFEFVPDIDATLVQAKISVSLHQWRVACPVCLIANYADADPQWELP